MEKTKLTFDQILDYVLGIGRGVANIESILTSTGAPGDRKEIEKPCNVAEAAEFTHLEVATIYKLVHTRSIPFHKKGRKLYFYKSELNEWIRSGQVNPLDTIARDAEKTFLGAQKNRR